MGDYFKWPKPSVWYTTSKDQNGVTSKLPAHLASSRNSFTIHRLRNTRKGRVS